MKINEFSKLQEKQNYKHIALYDKFDKCRVRFNGQKNSSADKLKVIENRLESEIYNDDYYIIIILFIIIIISINFVSLSLLYAIFIKPI